MPLDDDRIAEGKEAMDSLQEAILATYTIDEIRHDRMVHIAFQTAGILYDTLDLIQQERDEQVCPRWADLNNVLTYQWTKILKERGGL